MRNDRCVAIPGRMARRMADTARDLFAMAAMRWGGAGGGRGPFLGACCLLVLSVSPAWGQTTDPTDATLSAWEMRRFYTPPGGTAAVQFIPPFDPAITNYVAVLSPLSTRLSLTALQSTESGVSAVVNSGIEVNSHLPPKELRYNDLGTSQTHDNLGDFTIYQGLNSFSVVTTSSDGSTLTYTLDVYEEESGAVPAPAAQEILYNSPLRPAELGPGDSFRVMFSAIPPSGGDPFTATDGRIATYNDAILDAITDWTDSASSGGRVAALQSVAGTRRAGTGGFGTAFRALASAAGSPHTKAAILGGTRVGAVHARDNTATTHTNSDPGVPIYWLNGDRVANNYADFYDGSWGSYVPRNIRGNANGANSSHFTGSNSDGTMEAGYQVGGSRLVGDVRVGVPGTPLEGIQSSGTSDPTPTGAHRLYALSPELQVASWRLIDIAVATDGRALASRPAFASEITEYQVSVDPSTVPDFSAATTQVTITPTLSVPDMDTVTVNGVTTDSGSPVTVDLEVGGNLIPVVLTSGGTTTTYALNVVRAATDGFVTTWVVPEDDRTIEIPGDINRDYDYTVHWGDGAADTNVGTASGTAPWNDNIASHEYAAAGTYTVTIYGTFPHIRFRRIAPDYSNGEFRLTRIEQWGNIEWRSFDESFTGCYTLNIADDAGVPDLSLVRNLSDMFERTEALNADLSGWDVSRVTDMTQMFWNASAFNNGGAPLNWDVGMVNSMSDMFTRASNFNVDISEWNINSGAFINNMLLSSGLSVANYDAVLAAWAQRSNDAPSNVLFGADGLRYCDHASRAALSASNPGRNWTISGDSLAAAEDCALTLSDNSLSINYVTGSPVTQVLPAAEGGVTPLSYTLSGGDAMAISGGAATTFGDLPGLTYTHATRTLSGMPSGSITAVALTYAVTDNSNGAASARMNQNQALTYMVSVATSVLGNLASLTVTAASPSTDTSPLTLIPAFSPNLTAYMASMDGGTVDDFSTTTTSVVITPTVNGADTFTVNGVTPGVGGAVTVNLNVGENAIPVVVSSGGAAALTYTLNVVRADPQGFVTTWVVPDDDRTIQIPGNNSLYDYTVHWGDSTVDMEVGTASGTTPWSGNRAFHTYAEAGTYTVTLYGTFPRINFSRVNPPETRITRINQWGNIAWSTFASAFSGLSALTIANTAGSPDLSAVTDLTSMFENAEMVNANLSAWDVSTVTRMDSMFRGAVAFDGDLSGWDVAEVTRMPTMFDGAESFTGSGLSSWDVGKVTNMASMFDGAESFTGSSISGWDVSKVVNMNSMFRDADAFNVSLGGWEVGEVTNMASMFDDAESFTGGGIGSWEVGKVTNMNSMFRDADAFNVGLSGWDVREVTNMASMFYDAESFTGGGIDSWNVGKVTNMNSMFRDADVFNADLGGWEVGEVTDMASMFQDAAAFNTDLSGWAGKVSKVTNMNSMFRDADIFNADLGSWEVGEVTDMASMFRDAAAFNGDLSGWAGKVGKVTDMSYMFQNVAIFNQNISGWNVGMVRDMAFMFQNAAVFNADLSGWDVALVTDMESLFHNATAFNRNIGGWDIGRATVLRNMIANSGLSIANYDAVLAAWAQHERPPMNTNFAATGLTYCDHASRIILTGNYSFSPRWNISGDRLGTDLECPLTLSGTSDFLTYDEDSAIMPLTLPIAEGGVTPLAYFLGGGAAVAGDTATTFGNLPGLTYTHATRTLSGTPTTPTAVGAAVALTYTVMDGSNAADRQRVNQIMVQTYTVTVNTDRPRLSITDDISGIAGGDVTFTFTFSEDVRLFTESDIVVSGGSAGIFSSVSDAVYTLVVAPDDDIQNGTIMVSVADGVARAGPTSRLSTAAEASQSYDTAAPMFTSATDVAAPLNAPATTVVYTARADDGDGSGVASYMLGSGGDEGMFTLGSTDGELRYDAVQSTETTHNITITATDAAGNTVSQAVRVALVDRPVLYITDNASAELVTAAVEFTFTFSEAVSGFARDDITVSGGTAGTLGGSGAVYTLTVTPFANTQRGTIMVTVPENRAAAAAGDTARMNTAAEARRRYDTAAPIFTSAAAAFAPLFAPVTNLVYAAVADEGDGSGLASYTLGGTDAALFTLDENGELRYNTVQNWSTTHRVTITATDHAGNTAEQMVSVQLTNRPVLTITDDVSADLTTGDVTFTLSFSEEVYFSSVFISVTGGDAGAFVGTSGDAVYTLVVTPYADIQNGTIMVSVPRNAGQSVTKGFGIRSTEAEASQGYDTAAPMFTSGATATVPLSAPITAVAYTAVADEGGGSGVASYTLSGADAALFTLDMDDGELRYNNALSAEATHHITITATDRLGNTAEQRVTVNVVDRPVLNITDNVSADFTNRDVEFTFTFSEVVSGFSRADITVAGAASIGTLTPAGNSAVYTLVVAPLGDTANGTITVTVAENVAAAAAGDMTRMNTAAAASQGYDTAAPIFTSATAFAVALNTPITTVVYTAQADDEGGSGVASYTIGGAHASLFTLHPSNGELRYNDVYAAEVDHNITLTATDAAGNTADLAVTANVVDRPVLTITDDVSADFTNGEVEFTFTFSEAVSGFTGSDITVDGHASTDRLTSVNSRVYTLMVTPNDDTANGAITVTVAENMAAAAAGDTTRMNTAATASQRYDTVLPTFTSGATATVGLNTPTTAVVYTALADDGGGSGVASYMLGSGGDEGMFTLDLIDGELRYNAVQSAEATHRITLIATDRAGNTTDQMVTVSVADRPVLTITDNVDADFTNREVEFTFTFSEAVSGFSGGDITVDGVLPTNVGTLGGSGAVYTLVVTPNSDTANGTITVTVAENVADAAGGDMTRMNTAATKRQGYDTAVPMFTSATAFAVPLNLPTTTVVYTALADDGDGSGVVSYTLGGAHAALFTIGSTDGALRYNAVQTSETTHNITLIAMDRAGNTAQRMVTVSVVDRPVLNITKNVSADFTNGNVAFTFTFSEAVSGFTAGDITVDGVLPANVGTLSGSGAVYTLAVTPNPNTANGTITVTVAENVAAAAAGDTTRMNTAATASQRYDTAAPTFTSGATAVVALNTPTTTVVYTALAGDGGGSGVASYMLGSGGDEGMFTLDATAGALRYNAVQSTEVEHSITLTATDAVGNTADLAVTVSVVDRPVLTITDNVSADFTNGAVEFTFTFSEVVSGFAAGDITITGETASGTLTSADNRVYTLVVTPNNHTPNGTITVTVAENVAAAAAGDTTRMNTAAAASQRYDTSLPTFTSGATATVALNTPTTTVVYTARADDAGGSGVASYSIGGTDAARFTLDTTDGELRYNAVQSAEVTHDITLIATDRAGNSNQRMVTVNVFDRPILTISDNVSADLTNGDVEFTFTFSEVVSGFTGSDITVAGAASTGTLTPAGNSTVYTLVVTPIDNIANGAITVTVPENMAAAATGDTTRMNTAATASQGYDTAAPIFTSATVAAVALNTPATTVVYTAAADDGGGAGVASYTLSGTDAALFTLDMDDGELRYNAVQSLVVAHNITLTATDGVGNANQQMVTVSVVDRPVLIITDNVSAEFANGDVTFTFSFSEAVNVFAGGDIAVEGDTATSTLTPVSDRVYTLVVTPIDDVPDGTITVMVPENVANATTGDLTRMMNTMAQARQRYDTAAPIFTSATAFAVPLNTPATAVVYTALADDENGSGVASYTLGGAHAALFTLDADDGELRYNAAQSTEVVHNITLTATDRAGNTTERMVTVNVVDRPVLTISDNVSGIFAGREVEFTFAFSEAVSGFTAADDITIAGVLPANVGTLSGSGAVYTLVVEPNPDTANGTITVTVPEGAANAAADATRMSAAAAVSRRYDTAAPTFTSGGMATVALDTPITTVVYTAMAGDGGGSRVASYTLGGTHAALFTLGSTDGELRYNAVQSTDVVHNITITATDMVGNAADQEVTVTVGMAPSALTIISLSAADGTYGIGAVVNITVTFSDEVNVTGTPQLTLETGSTDAVANYSTGHGSAELVFIYTVAAEHASDDLDAISLSGDITAADGSNTDVDLTSLPSGTAPGSLAQANAVVIDGIAPTNTATITGATDDVGSVTGALVSGATTDDTMPLLAGTFTGALASGEEVRIYNNGSDELGAATVAAGTTSWSYQVPASALADGDTAVFTARVVDAADNQGPASADFTLIIDTTVLTLTITMVAGDATSGTFYINENDDATAVVISGTTTAEVGQTVSVTLEDAATPTPNSVTVTATVTAGTPNQWSTAAANISTWTQGNITLTAEVSGVTGDPVTAIYDTTAPSATPGTDGATITLGTDGVTITIVASEALAGIAGTDDFDVEVDGEEVTVSTADINDDGDIILTITPAAVFGDAVTLAYTGDTVTDAAGNPLGTFSAQTVTNDVPDPDVPRIVSLEAGPADTTNTAPYSIGESVAITVVFSEDVNVTGTPQLTLETGSTDGVANYTPPSFPGTTARLRFIYTVASGHESADLDAIELTLNGGTIKAVDDAADADLTSLPTGGLTTGSLAEANDVVIDGVRPVFDSNTPLTLTVFIFASAVHNFNATDNGGAVDEGITYTMTGDTSQFDLDPSTGVVTYSSPSGTPGTYQLTFTAADEAGNTSEAHEVAVTVTGTPTPGSIDPTVTITDGTTDENTNAPVDFTFMFVEPVSGFTVDDVDVTGGTKASAFTDGADGSMLWVLEITPTPDVQSGILTVNVPEDVAISDFSGRMNQAADAEATQQYDTAAPTITSPTTATVTATVATTDTVYTAEATDTAGTGVASYTLGGDDAALFTLDTDDGELRYNAVQTSAATHEITITATDEVGNTTAEFAVTVTVIGTPVVTITNDTSGSPIYGDVTFTFMFTEAVSGFTVDDVAVTGGDKASDFASGSDGSDTWTLAVTPTLGARVRTITVSVAAGAATGDTSGLLSESATATLDVTLANIAPTVANQIPDQTATEGVAFTYAFSPDTFDDDVDTDATFIYTATWGGASWLTFTAATRTFTGTPDDDTDLTIVVTATERDDTPALFVSNEFTLTVEANVAPTVENEIPDQTATVGVAFTYTFPLNTFADENTDAGDTLSYTATLGDDSALPSWLSFTEATRAFAGTPPPGTTDLTIKVTATDSATTPLSVSDTFTLTVVANNAPTVETEIPDQAATVGVAFTYTFPLNTFADTDAGDTLSYTATLDDDSTLPTWLTFTEATRAFAGTPQNDTDLTIKVTATDSATTPLSVSDTFTLTVEDNNAPTVENEIPDQAATVGVAFTYTFPLDTFADENTDASDTLSYTAIWGGAGWLTFTAATRTFTGTPPQGATDLTIVVTATDGAGLSVSDTFTLTVHPADVTRGLALRFAALNKTVIPQISQAITVGVLNSVAERIIASERGNFAAPRYSVGGQSNLRDLLPAHGRAMLEGTMDYRSLLEDISFSMPLQRDEDEGVPPGSDLSMWGGVDYAMLNGLTDDANWQGGMYSAHFGMDKRRADTLFGLGFHWAKADFDYEQSDFQTEGDYQYATAGVNPYFGWFPNEYVKFWSMIKYSNGEIILEEDGHDPTTADTTQQSLAFGIDKPVVGLGIIKVPDRATTVSFRFEGLFTEVKVDQGEIIPADELTSHRLRLLLIGEHQRERYSGSILAPHIAVGVRYEAGTIRNQGWEIGPGLRYSHPNGRFTVNSNLRFLDSGTYDEWGADITLHLLPDDVKRGLYFDLGVNWGDPTDTTGQLWDSGIPTADPATAHSKSELGHTSAATLLHTSGTLTPYTSFSTTSGGRDFRIGNRFSSDNLTMQLEAIREWGDTDSLGAGFNITIIW